MAVMLENMPSITVMARTLINTVYRTAQIVASLPNLAYQNKARLQLNICPILYFLVLWTCMTFLLKILQAFPEALFHQLLLAMVYEDHETRVAAHRIFSVVLVPSSFCPRSATATTSIPNKAPNMQRMLSRTVSVFSSSAALFEKMKKEEHTKQENTSVDTQQKVVANDPSMLTRLKSSYSRAYSVKRNPSTNENSTENNPSMLNRLKSSYSRAYSMKKIPSPVTEEEITTTIPIATKEQVSYLLSFENSL